MPGRGIIQIQLRDRPRFGPGDRLLLLDRPRRTADGIDEDFGLHIEIIGGIGINRWVAGIEHPHTGFIGRDRLAVRLLVRRDVPAVVVDAVDAGKIRHNRQCPVIIGGCRLIIRPQAAVLVKKDINEADPARDGEGNLVIAIDIPQFRRSRGFTG